MEQIELFDHRIKKKVTVDAKRSTKTGEYLTRCINPDHEDKHPSMGIDVVKGVYHCWACNYSGVTMKKHLEGAKTPGAIKKAIQKKEDNEAIQGILEALSNDLLNWEGYDPDIKEEARSRLAFDLCYLPEKNKVESIKSLVEAGIFRRPELLDRLKKIEGLLKPIQKTKEEEEVLSKQKFNPRPYSNKVLEDYSLKHDTLKRFWIYSKKRGLWIEKAESILNSLLRKKILGEKDFKVYCVKEILEDLKGLSLKVDEPVEPTPELIPFNNLVYDIKNQKEIAFSPEYFFINKLAVNYNSKAKAFPTIRKVFQEIVGQENVITLLEIIAYCMWRAYPYPKAFFLFGSGANGKSAFIKVLRRIIGNRNISTETSTDFQRSNFSVGRLYGKLANVTSEMEYNILKNTIKVKMATGEDLIPCERKFKESFNFQNYAKLIFLTNQIPLTTDKTFAFYRRIFLLEFPNKFILGENADPNVIDNIRQSEFEGFASWAVNRLIELKKNDFVFTNHKRTEEITEQYESLSNPLSKFVKEFTIREPDSDIPKNELLSRFNAYQKDKGFRIWTDIETSREMRSLGFHSKTLTRGETGEKRAYNAWIEIFWK